MFLENDVYRIEMGESWKVVFSEVTNVFGSARLGWIGLQLKKIGSGFSSCNFSVCLGKITQNRLWLVLPFRRSLDMFPLMSRCIYLL